MFFLAYVTLGLITHEICEMVERRRLVDEEALVTIFLWPMVVIVGVYQLVLVAMRIYLRKF